MPARAALVLLAAAAAILAGCSEASPDQPPLPPGSVDARVAAVPFGAKLAWHATLANHVDESFPGATAHIKVVRRGDIPVGEDSRSVSIPANGNASVQLTTPFIGPGDYFYTLRATGSDGRLLVEATGMYETCFCTSASAGEGTQAPALARVLALVD